MSDKREPQPFSAVIEAADHGRIDKILSRDLQRIVETTTDKANLHETEWKGEMTLKIKVTAEPNGKVTLAFDKTTKVKEEGLPKARMYYSPDSGALTNDVPRQVKIPGFDDDGRPRAKSAPAPKTGGGNSDN
jgi:hypothetical protein